MHPMVKNTVASTWESVHLVLELRIATVRWPLNLLLRLLTGWQSPWNHQRILQKLTLLHRKQISLLPLHKCSNTCINARVTNNTKSIHNCNLSTKYGDQK